MLYNFVTVILHKILGKKTDFFQKYKFNMIEHHYGDKCLDVGSGTGRFANFLKVKLKDIHCIDIVNKTEFHHQFKLFDGINIPYESNSMDTLLLFFVLHHTDNQEELLNECKRVTHGNIIIGEDIIENRLDKIMGKLHLGTSPWAKSNNGFRTDQGWKKLFTKIGFKIIDEVIIPRSTYPVYPITRKIYILKIA